MMGMSYILSCPVPYLFVRLMQFEVPDRMLHMHDLVACQLLACFVRHLNACARGAPPSVAGTTCATALHDAYDRFYWLNPYDILEDCHTGVSSQKPATFNSNNKPVIKPDVPNVAAAAARKLAQGRQQHEAHNARASSHSMATNGQQAQLRTLQPGSVSPDDGGAPVAAPLQAAEQALRGMMHWPLSGIFNRSRPVTSWHGLVGHVVPCADRT